jgi:negative regulator of sigma E activity
MDPQPPSREEELRLREEALRARELQIRMRELEAELDPVPVQSKVQQARVQQGETYKHEETSRRRRPWYRRLPELAKFILIVIAVVVAVRLAVWLATAVLVLTVGWVAYKLFLEGDDV